MYKTISILFLLVGFHQNLRASLADSLQSERMEEVEVKAYSPRTLSDDRNGRLYCRHASCIGQCRPLTQPATSSGGSHQQRLYLRHPHTGMCSFPKRIKHGRGTDIQRLPPVRPVFRIQRLSLPRHGIGQEPSRCRFLQPFGRRNFFLPYRFHSPASIPRSTYPDGEAI